MQQTKHWHYLQSNSPATVEEGLKLLLANRAITEEIHFFHPPSPLSITPEQVGLDLTKLTQAVDLLTTAIKQQQKVVIFGDYDADGVSATAILWEALYAQGLVAEPFIPHRLKHGYGLSVAALEEIFMGDKPDLIVTVDNGIVAHPALAWLKKRNIPVILTDHHQPDEQEPTAAVVVHSTQICGSGVSWFLARELNVKAAEQQLDLLGMATLADQMPLVGANRAFAYHGLKALQKTTRPGLIALKLVANLTEPVTNQAVQFGLIPRLNAMGRLEHGLTSLRLLCVKSAARAKDLAAELDKTNQQRQKLTGDLLAEAVEQANTQRTEHLVVVSSPLFHEGVIGLLAGKLLETVFKPVIALHIGEKTAKASIRSVPGCNIIEFLRAQSVNFLELGGHALAAGFVIESRAVKEIVFALQEAAKIQISLDLLVPSVSLEFPLPLHLANTELVKALNRCEPFGQANPTPLFGLENLKIVEMRQLGAESQHLKIVVCDEHGQTLPVMFWRQGELAHQFKNGQRVRVAGRLEVNEWKGRVTVQLIGSDIQPQI